MSLINAIRRAAGGAGKPRLEDEKPETDDEETSAEAEEKDASAEDDGAEPDAEAKDGEEEDAEEDKSMSAEARAGFARGRRAERRRLAAILGSKEAEASPALAAHYAFQTSDPASKALAALKAAGPSAATGLASRMTGRSGSRLGAGGEKAAGKDHGSGWDSALAKAGVARKGK
jgi:hypothetical protein